MGNLEDKKIKIIDSVKKGKDETVLKYVEKVLRILNEMKEKDDEIYRYFSDIYDNIFHDILFEKAKIEHNTRKLLEMLALPVNARTLILKEKILKKNFGKRV
jgi:hypothetical protein